MWRYCVASLASGVVVGYDLLDEWDSERAALQECMIDVRDNEDRSTQYQVMSMMPISEEVGLLTGERIYCDERWSACCSDRSVTCWSRAHTRGVRGRGPARDCSGQVGHSPRT